MTWALAEQRYNWHDLELNSKQARYFGIPLEFKGRFFEYCKDTLFNRHRFVVYDLTEKNFKKQLITYKKNKFKYIYGYTNSIFAFSKYLIKEKITLKEICPSLNACIVTSETLNADDRKLISLATGVYVINEYGVSEAGGIVAFEDSKKRWRLSEETQFIEIVDENNNNLDLNHAGQILITDLYNKAMPFIRYKVGDMGSLCELNGQILLEKLSGRTNDTIKLPSGKIAAGLTFYYISRSILESSGLIKKFIIRQVAINKFIFEIISQKDLSINEKKTIKDKMDKYLEPGLEVEFNIVDEIPVLNSNKLKHFISEINE